MISGIPTQYYNAFIDKLIQLSRPRSLEYAVIGDNDEHRKHLHTWTDLGTAAETVRISHDLKCLHGFGRLKFQHCAAAKKIHIEHDVAQFLFSQVAVGWTTEETAFAWIFSSSRRSYWVKVAGAIDFLSVRAWKHGTPSSMLRQLQTLAEKTTLATIAISGIDSRH
jgi:hypothetical protein